MRNAAAYLVALPLVAALSVSSALCAPQVKQTPQGVLPAPRITRQIPGWVVGESSFVGLKAATPNVLVVQVERRRDEKVTRLIAALNRGVQNVHWEKEAEGINLSNQSIRAHWDVLGSVSAQNGKPAASVLVLERQIFFSRYVPHANTQYENQITLYGTDEASRIMWQFPAKDALPNTTISAAPLFGDLLPVHTAGAASLVLWDAQTGTALDGASPAGKEAVKAAIQQNGSPLLQAWDRLYRLDTGASFPIPHERVGDEILTPLGVTNDRAFWLTGGDDGFMGHSSWPYYLIASDENGKFLWQFPEGQEQNFTDSGSDAPSAGRLMLTRKGSDEGYRGCFRVP